jgi:hypothetical protein
LVAELMLKNRVLKKSVIALDSEWDELDAIVRLRKWKSSIWWKHQTCL